MPAFSPPTGGNRDQKHMGNSKLKMAGKKILLENQKLCVGQQHCAQVVAIIPYRKYAKKLYKSLRTCALSCTTKHLSCTRQVQGLCGGKLCIILLITTKNQELVKIRVIRGKFSALNLRNPKEPTSFRAKYP